MSKFHGKFVWYELTTSDPKAAAAFYCAVNNWTAKDSGIPGMAYTIVSAGEAGVGGFMAIPEDARKAGAPAHWVGYVAVDDADDIAARVTKAGGKIYHGPSEIPGVGRFAVLADPQGAAFAVIKGVSNDPPREPAAPGTPGHTGWHELHAGDMPKAFSFYADLFGWTKSDAVDMGPMGTYQLFATGGPAVGGMMTKMPQVPKPFWLYYFNVDEIGAAVARITGNGGKVVLGPQQVPGGSWIVNAIDPQGAMFAVVGPKR